MKQPLRGPAPPFDGNAGDPYATWDAAYVLGSLSAAERREFEAHLAGCSACRDAVAELSGIPALLSQLSIDDVAAIASADEIRAQRVAAIGSAAIDESSRAPQLSPQLLPSLQETVRWRRRRARITTWVASAAAAVVLAVGVLVGLNGSGLFGTHPQPTITSAQPMAQVGTKLLTSTISVSSRNWGTFINLECYCLAPPDAHHDTLAMVVVGRDGSQTRLATWVAEPGHTASPAGSISTPLDQIASVQVVAADSGQILLERSL